MKSSIFKYLKGDKVIWIIIFILLILSLLAVFSATGMLAYKYRQGNTGYYFMRHFIFLGIGFLAIYITHRIPYKIYFGLTNIILGIAIILLFFTLFLGTTKNDATRWLVIPFIGIDFQTSDLGKFALIMFIAKTLSQYQENKEELNKAFRYIMIAIIVVCALILPADFSTTGLLLLTSWVLMFIGRIDSRYLFSLVGIAAIGIVLFILVVSGSGTKSRVGTWESRIENFISGDGDGNHQADQAKIAIIKGGFFGKGPGNSTQRNILPHPYSDFIYAIIIEEYGAFGGIVVLMLYIILLYRTVIIVRKLERTFPAFLSIGLAMSLVFQALLNMAVAVNLFPVTGQPLPFVSMGGTSIVFASVAVGIILNISRYADKKEEAEIDETREFEVKDYPFIAG